MPCIAVILHLQGYTKCLCYSTWSAFKIFVWFFTFNIFAYYVVFIYSIKIDHLQDYVIEFVSFTIHKSEFFTLVFPFSYAFSKYNPSFVYTKDVCKTKINWQKRLHEERNTFPAMVFLKVRFMWFYAFMFVN